MTNASNTWKSLRAMSTGQFLNLKQKWYNDTFLSSQMEDGSNEHYKKIIEASNAIHLIMEDWKQSADHETSHWFAALTIITGHNPIPDKDRGRIPKMRDHWLKWYDEYYLPMHRSAQDH